MTLSANSFKKGNLDYYTVTRYGQEDSGAGDMTENNLTMDIM